MNPQLTPTIILSIVLAYFLVLIGISVLTSKKADNATFFNAKKQSPWFVVAFGMIGASLSGATFISVPGLVGAGGTNMEFSYMQMVLGYLVGYFIIATVLMPIYYRLNLTSIYGYLEQRFGNVSYKMGAFYFLVSRIIGASFRLFLMAMVLDQFILGPLGFSFSMTVFVTIVLIWTYTYKGGIKTIVWTDTLQTVCMLTAVIATIIAITKAMGTDLSGMWALMDERNYTEAFHFEGAWSDPNNFFKQFLSGALMALVMTGLDQDMMQKNLTCRNLKDAQKNVFSFSIILVFANILFLSLGAMLYIYADSLNIGIPERTDMLYPMLALEHLPMGIGIVFILGLIAAAYSSADSALTSLTTSFCIDFLNFEKSNQSEKDKKRNRTLVHIGFSVILFITIISFNALNNDAVINGLLKAAGYTYGPILGLFAFGILNRRKVIDKWVWIVALLSPFLSYILDINSAALFGGLSFGFMILAVNGVITFLGLWLLSLNQGLNSKAI